MVLKPDSIREKTIMEIVMPALNCGACDWGAPL